MIATITRNKIYPTPGTNPRFAWKYYYDVEILGSGKVLAGFDSIVTARKIAKLNGATQIIESWQKK